MESEEDKWNEVKQKVKIGDQVEEVLIVKPPYRDFVDLEAGLPGLLLRPDMIDLTPKIYRAGQ